MRTLMRLDPVSLVGSVLMEVAAAIAKTKTAAQPQEQPQDVFQSSREGRNAEQITAVLAQFEGQPQNLTGPAIHYRQQQILAEAHPPVLPAPLAWPEARRPVEPPRQDSQALVAGVRALPAGVWALIAALAIVLWYGKPTLLWLAWLLAGALFLSLLAMSVRGRT